MELIKLAQNRDDWRATVNTIEPPCFIKDQKYVHNLIEYLVLSIESLQQ